MILILIIGTLLFSNNVIFFCKYSIFKYKHMMELILKFIYEKSSNLSMKNIPYNQLYQRVSNLPTMDITC